MCCLEVPWMQESWDGVGKNRVSTSVALFATCSKEPALYDMANWQLGSPGSELISLRHQVQWTIISEYCFAFKSYVGGGGQCGGQSKIFLNYNSIIRFYLTLWFGCLRGSEDYMLQLLLPANIKPLCTLVIINAACSPKYGSASCNNAPVSRSELRPGETKMQVHISELEQAPWHSCHWEVRMCGVQEVSEPANMFTPALCDTNL